METIDYQKQAADFFKRNGLRLRMTKKGADIAPAWGGSNHNRYVVTIWRERPSENAPAQPHRITFSFWGSINDFNQRKDPTAHDILACISGDAYCADTLAEFVSDFGWHERDPLETIKVFNNCRRFARRLQKFFTESELTELAEI